jgi:hypothetical protein
MMQMKLSCIVKKKKKSTVVLWILEADGSNNKFKVF